MNFKSNKREILNERRMEERIRKSLDSQFSNRQEQELNESIRANNEMYEAIRKTNNDRVKRRRDQLNESKQEFSYREDLLKGLIEDQCVNIITESLLVDDTYFEKHPNYKQDISETVKTILDIASINEGVDDEDAAFILESACSQIPSYQDLMEGHSSLTEATVSLRENVMSQAAMKAAGSIERLSNKIRNNVLGAIQDESNSSAMIMNDLEALVITESTDLYREVKSSEFIESLAIADAKRQINESGDYDKELAINNAIVNLTILEGINALGVVSIDNHFKQQYVSLVNQESGKETATSGLNESVDSQPAKKMTAAERMMANKAKKMGM